MRKKIILAILIFSLFLFSSGMAHDIDMETINQLAEIRLATSKYLDIEKAKSDGYIQSSGMEPKMGYHFLNPEIKEFNPTKPNVLLYVKSGNQWQLVGVEYGFPTAARPSTPPFKGAVWSLHHANCHYKDGTEMHSDSEDKCPKTNPITGSEFGSWHPDLSSIHLWIWYHNPLGIFAELNPLLLPFSEE